MKSKKTLFSLFVFFLLAFIASASWANDKPESRYRSDSEMRVLGPGDPGYERYVQILDEVRHDPQGVRCVVSQCATLMSWATPKKIRNGHFYARCLHEHRLNVKEPDYAPLKNPPGVGDLLCKTNLRESVSGLNPEIGSRAFTRYLRLQPTPQSPKLDKKEAERALEELRRADVEAGRLAPATRSQGANKPPAKRANSVTTPKSNRGFVRNPKIAELLVSDPETMQRVIDKYAERRKGAIRCIPRNTELVQLDEDGDVYLFVRQGADVADLKRCFPKHGFDARMTAHNNDAAVIILYYLVDENKPARGNNLVFHEGRWNIKKPQWSESGRTFYADWFAQNKDKKFGFALQAGQKIFLRMADTWGFETEEESDTATDANKAKPKHGYNSVNEEIDESRQYRLAENCAGKQQIFHFSVYDRKSRVNASSSNKAVSCGAEIPNDADFAGQVKKAIVAVSEVYIPQITEIQSAGRAYIRAGPRVNRVMYISQERYRQKNGGADLNKNIDNVHLLSQQEKLLCRERYGAYAFS